MKKNLLMLFIVSTSIITSCNPYQKMSCGGSSLPTGAIYNLASGVPVGPNYSTSLGSTAVPNHEGDSGSCSWKCPTRYSSNGSACVANAPLSNITLVYAYPKMDDAVFCEDYDLNGKCDLGEKTSSYNSSTKAHTFSAPLSQGSKVLIKSQGHIDGRLNDVSFVSLVPSDTSTTGILLSPITTLIDKGMSITQIAAALTSATSQGAPTYSFTDLNYYPNKVFQYTKSDNGTFTIDIMSMTGAQYSTLTSTEQTNFKARLKSVRANYVLLQILKALKNTTSLSLSGPALANDMTIVQGNLRKILTGLLDVSNATLNVDSMNSNSSSLQNYVTTARATLGGIYSTLPDPKFEVIISSSDTILSKMSKDAIAATKTGDAQTDASVEFTVAKSAYETFITSPPYGIGYSAPVIALIRVVYGIKNATAMNTINLGLFENAFPEISMGYRLSSGGVINVNIDEPNNNITPIYAF